MLTRVCSYMCSAPVDRDCIACAHHRLVITAPMQSPLLKSFHLHTSYLMPQAPKHDHANCFIK